MSATAKGTAVAPGRNVKAKSGLNKSILDAAWGDRGFHKTRIGADILARGAALGPGATFT